MRINFKLQSGARYSFKASPFMIIDGREVWKAEQSTSFVVIGERFSVRNGIEVLGRLISQDERERIYAKLESGGTS